MSGSLDALPACEKCLSTDESARAGRISRAPARNLFVLGRGILRKLLGRALGCGADAVPLAENALGKPALARSRDLSFSLSHSEDLMLFALSAGPGEIGLDVERVRPVATDELALLCLHPTEWEALDGSSGLRGAARFFQLWTAKEALLKAVGVGLSVDPRELALRWRREPRGGIRVHALETAPDAIPRREAWTFRRVGAVAGYVAALAADRPIPAVSARDFLW